MHCGTITGQPPQPPRKQPPVTAKLTILIVEPDKHRAEAIIDSLTETGDHHIRVLSESTGLARSVAELNPDLVLVDVANPSRDAIDALTLASSPLERPVAMFVDRSDDSLTKAAIEAGVSAYVVDGMHPDRVKPVLDAAIARFHMFARMRNELAATKRALEERKIIDRAKGILMRARGLPEEEAYALIRKTAMSQGKKIVDVAQALVTASELLS
nr:ANTAR domain-containing protein [Shimia sp. R9_1]